MLLSSQTRLGEIGRDFQCGFRKAKNALSFEGIFIHRKAPWAHDRGHVGVRHKRQPSLAGAWNWRPLPLYCGAGVAFGFFTTFFFGAGVAGAGGTPGTA